MFCCCVGNDVVSALVLWYDLVSFVRPAMWRDFAGIRGALVRLIEVELSVSMTDGLR